jgi:CRISPR/Cas system CSM-associated protein Csm2 small subunit
VSSNFHTRFKSVNLFPPLASLSNNAIRRIYQAADERTEEEIARALEKRQEQAKKMRDQLAKQRLEKVSDEPIYILSCVGLLTISSLSRL